MNSTSGSPFKMLRLIVFPVSLNAMGLGALAALLFYLVSLAACLLAGQGELATPVAEAFFPAVSSMIQKRTWPGYGMARNKDGILVHHLLAEKNPSPTAWSRARVDQDILQELFKPAILREIKRLIGNNKNLSPKQQEQEEKRFSAFPSSYRFIFLAQLLTFFFLWGTFGVAICRILALRIARDEICSMKAAWSYAWKIKLTALLYPVAVLLPVLFLVVCNGLAGTISSIPAVGWVLGIFFLPLVLLSSFLILLAVIVGLVSLGLIPAIVAVERKGTFDAAGKATNCLTARPLTVILYLVLMVLFIGGIVFHFLIDGHWVEHVLSKTIAPLFDSRYQLIAAGNIDATTGFANLLAWAHLGILELFRLFLWGLLISLTLGGFTSIFLVLRQDIDGIDPSDVARDPSLAPAPQEAGAAPEPAGPTPEKEDTKPPDQEQPQTAEPEPSAPEETPPPSTPPPPATKD